MSALESEARAEVSLRQGITPQRAAVYADWLEEQGDPQAELIRLQLLGRSHVACLEANWKRWFGKLKPRDCWFLLSHGFATVAWFDEQVPPDVLASPVLRFVDEIRVKRGGSLSGVERLGSLKNLDLRFTGKLDPGDRQRFATATLPALRRLSLTLPATPMPEIVELLATSRWAAQLERLSIIIASPVAYEELLAQAEFFSQFGERLEFASAVDLALAHRPQMLAALPTVRHRPIPDSHPDREFSTFPTIKEPPFFHGKAKTCGPRGLSGVHFCLCAGCASFNTQDVFYDAGRMDYSERKAETYCAYQREYRCLDCGRVTHWYVNTTS